MHCHEENGVLYQSATVWSGLPAAAFQRTSSQQTVFFGHLLDTGKIFFSRTLIIISTSLMMSSVANGLKPCDKVPLAVATACTKNYRPPLLVPLTWKSWKSPWFKTSSTCIRHMFLVTKAQQGSLKESPFQALGLSFLASVQLGLLLCAGTSHCPTNEMMHTFTSCMKYPILSLSPGSSTNDLWTISVNAWLVQPYFLKHQFPCSDRWSCFTWLVASRSGITQSRGMYFRNCHFLLQT